MLTVITGASPNSSTKYLSSAAPVGVQSSLFILPEYVGMPRSMSSVAGAGTGSTPCAHFTVPPPTLTGEAYTLSGASRCISMHTFSTSAIASMLPTSWKCTFLTAQPCTLLSASAIIL